MNIFVHYSLDTFLCPNRFSEFLSVSCPQRLIPMGCVIQHSYLQLLVRFVYSNSFSARTLPTSSVRSFLLWGSVCPMHCGVFSSTIGFHSLNVSGTPTPIMAITNVSRHCQMSYWGAVGPLRSTGLTRESNRKWERKKSHLYT